MDMYVWRHSKYTRYQNKEENFRDRWHTRLKLWSETGTKVDQNNVQATELRFIRQVAECIILDDKLDVDVRRELDIFYFIGWVTTRTDYIVPEACKIPESQNRYTICQPI
jgi:hypothetical protein